MIETWLGHNTARFIYYSYKDSPYYFPTVFLSVLLISVILISNFVKPLAESWFSIRDETIAVRQRVAIINSNIVFMKKLNKVALEINRQTAIRALPVQKDFADIISALTISSLRSGVSLENFTFGLGPVSDNNLVDSVKDGKQFNPIALSLTIKGNLNAVKNFIKELEKKVPLSEVSSVDTEDGNTIISLIFYTKPYSPIKIKEDEPIPPISAANNSILDTLSIWNPEVNNSAEILSPSSSIPLF